VGKYLYSSPMFSNGQLIHLFQPNMRQRDLFLIFEGFGVRLTEENGGVLDKLKSIL